MPGSGRLRAIGAASALVLALGLAVAGTRPSALAAPSTFQIVGSGYGHGIGMSQYGAHGMALRGASVGRIISFSYGGASARPATLPATIRVGMLQANRDPSTGRLGHLLVRGIEVPGLGGSGGFTVSGVPPAGGCTRGRWPGTSPGRSGRRPAAPRGSTLTGRGCSGRPGRAPAWWSATRRAAASPACCCPRPASSCAGAGSTSTWSATTAAPCGSGRSP
jgi:hypothetical protein